MPTSLTGGALSAICLPPVETEPAQLRTQTAIVSAQAELADSQQLWPSPTLVTRRDCSGCDSVTSWTASWYARLTSSVRAKRGAWPAAVWQAPQRLPDFTFSHTLSLNACTSAVAGAGPV